MYRSSDDQDIAAVWSPLKQRLDFVKPLPDVSERSWQVLPSQNILLLDREMRSWRPRANGRMPFGAFILSPGEDFKPESVPVTLILQNTLGPLADPLVGGFCPVSGRLLLTDYAPERPSRRSILCAICQYE